MLPDLYNDFYRPDMENLRGLSSGAVLDNAGISELLQRPIGTVFSLEELAGLFHEVVNDSTGAAGRRVTDYTAVLRHELFGNKAIPMAPIEMSNACASDCLFCGWRVSNRAMKRLKMNPDLIMPQVEYLLDQGIHYIEFVSGDDIQAVRSLLPELITRTRLLFEQRGIKGKIAFCTLALTQKQYEDLRELGADAMVVWQEAYDSEVFREHIVGGPKAFGISDDWKVDRAGDGCTFRIESQERALRSGLEVAMGSMLGLNPDVGVEFLATVDHARGLKARYEFSYEHPLIIGMPLWNAITTRATDLRPAESRNVVDIFPAIAGLYLMALPETSTWIFPNCRVPLAVQIEAARVAGVFTSTEVKLGPGGYLPSVIRERRARGENVDDLVERVRLALGKDGEVPEGDLQSALDEREQFIHHFHGHEVYERALEGAGLRLENAV